MANPLAQPERGSPTTSEALRDPLSIPSEVKASIRVLVVDDERTLRESCASVLQMDGYNVTLVGRGEEALETVKRRKFDVILVDLYMSQISGLEILQAALGAYKDTIVVVMTGNPSVTSSIEALRAGAPWTVRFVPFSLAQVHVAEGEPDIWTRPQDDTGLLAMQAAVVVREQFPDRFFDVHEALFALRHDEGKHLEDAGEVRRVLTASGVDADKVFREIEGGEPLDRVRREHTAAAEDHEVWGVPTFVEGEAAVFVRLMERPRGDAELARRTIERVVGLLTEFPELNEFKHTSLKR